MTEEPVGTWLCPSCSPTAAFYVKQLVKKPASSPVVPKIEKTDQPATSKPEKQKQAPGTETKKKEIVKKGVAVKKPAAKKPAEKNSKPKWLGWVEMSSDGEEEFKKNVDAQWSVEDGFVGKRTRASKATAKENGPSPRSLRPRSRPERSIDKEEDDKEEDDKEEDEKEEDEKEEADSDESVFQESEFIISSNDSDNSENAMDVDHGPIDTVQNISDLLSSLFSASGEGDPSTLGHEGSAPKWDDDANASENKAEDLEDSMDMGHQDEQHEASGNDPSDDPEYMDDGHSSGSSPLPVPTPFVREVADSVSSSPEPAPFIDLTEPSTISPGLEVSEPAIIIEDDDADSDVQEIQAPATPIVIDYAALYKRQGNCWGEFPESAVRSTLPRLG